MVLDERWSIESAGAGRSGRAYVVSALLLVLDVFAIARLCEF